MIKTGSWMQSSATNPSSTAAQGQDPILRKMEEDMASTGGGLFHPSSFLEATPIQSATATPSASSTISSLFSRALSLAGTPTAPQPSSLPAATSHHVTPLSTPTTQRNPLLRSATAVNSPVHGQSGNLAIMQKVGSSSYAGGSHLLGGRGRGRIERVQSLDRPSPNYGPISSSGLLSPRMNLGVSGGLSRQRSLESTESGPPDLMSGYRTPSEVGTPVGVPPGSRPHSRSATSRRRSEGGDIIDPFGPAPSRTGYRHPLTRGHSTASSSPSGTGGGRLFQNPSSTLSSPRSGHFPSSGSFQRPGSSAAQIMSSNQGGRLNFLPNSSFVVSESMSAPEDAGGIMGRNRLRSVSPAGSGPTPGTYNLYPRVLVSDGEARDLCPPLQDTPPTSGNISGGDPSRRGSFLDPKTAARRTFQRRKLDSAFRNDSLSSDQSECVSRPPPPKPHKSKRKSAAAGGAHVAGHSHVMSSGIQGSSGRRIRIRRDGSQVGSSSDDEIRSTPDYTSCGEEEMESESVSEKGKH